MIKVLICGISGKMGAIVSELLKDDTGAQAVCGVDPHSNGNTAIPTYLSFNEVKIKPDVIIDFSSPAALESELAYAKANAVPLVLASTGYSEKQLNDINEAAKSVAIFRTANFSVGVNLICKLVKQAAQALGEKFDIEII